MELRRYLEEWHTKQTADSYFRNIEKFKLHHKDPKNLTYQEIVEYLNKVKASQKVLAGIKKYYDYLIEVGEIESHPCKQLTIKRKRNDIQTQDLFDANELEQLLERESRYSFLKYRNKSIISLLIYQGLAVENIINLKEKDIDFDQGTIYIKATASLNRRILELKAKQVNYLMQYIYKERNKLNKEEHQNLFVGKLGEPITIDVLKRLLEPFKHTFKGKAINTTTIRQSVIRNHLKEGKSIEEVQYLSGLKWLSSVERYREANIEEKRKLIMKFHPLK